MTLKLSVICKKQNNGSYFAQCPELRGCFTQGDTYEKTIENLKELVEDTINNEYTPEEINELNKSRSIIFSEMNISVSENVSINP